MKYCSVGRTTVAWVRWLVEWPLQCTTDTRRADTKNGRRVEYPAICNYCISLVTVYNLSKYIQFYNLRLLYFNGDEY